MTITDSFEIILFMIKNTFLEQVGLNQSEIKIYKRLLDYGELTPPRLAMLTGLTRQNTYAALKTLVNKQLIEDVTNKKN
ncbi:MAG TPA: helix-turn-helix domain-containing protein [Patescibacteria group bacterium]|nr:helix-turn-helix domain-containing protein [Patescibacteria group bacterium]